MSTAQAAVTALTERRETPASPADAFRAQIERSKAQFAAALPPHIEPERFARVVMTAVQRTPDLLDADRKTLLAAAMLAAQDGLLPDGREGALVIYNTKMKGADGRESWTKAVQWMPMIAGILKKIRNSGELKSISANVVYEKDTFRFVLGDEERIEHEPYLGGDGRGKERFVYAIAHTTDGGIYREVMTREDIEQVRSASRAAQSGPWTKWWGEMARKTVLRRLAKRLPMSTDQDDLMRRDDHLFEGEKGGLDSPPGRSFRPVVNPLADTAPETIEHEAAPTLETVAVLAEAQLAEIVQEAPSAAEPPAEEETDAALKTARLRGADAARKGKLRKAVPAAYENRPDLTAAYLAGFDETPNPAEEAGR